MLTSKNGWTFPCELKSENVQIGLLRIGIKDSRSSETKASLFVVPLSLSFVGPSWSFFDALCLVTGLYSDETKLIVVFDLVFRDTAKLSY